MRIEDNRRQEDNPTCSTQPPKKRDEDNQEALDANVTYTP
jgi:hypothetical protein